LVLEVATWNPLKPGVEDEAFTYIDLSAVDQDLKTITGARAVSCADAPSRARQIVRAGDVLVSTVRPNLNGVALVTTELDGATASTGFCVIRPNPELLDSSFVFHWVKSPSFVSSMVNQATGASYPAVSDRIVLDSRIPLPPLPEQHRIAAIFDKADALRTKRREALVQIDCLAQSIFVEMFGDPEEPTGQYPQTTLGELCLRITDGTHQSPTWTSEGIPFLFISNIVNGKINFDTDKYISRETYEELTRRCPIEKGDVLYTTVGSYGNSAVVSSDEEFCFQRHIAHIKPDPAKLDSVFCAAMIESPGVRRQVDKVARGVAQKTVNLSDLKALKVLAPDLDVQRSFTQKIASLQRLKNQQLMGLAQSDDLFLTIQHRAFRGGL
jgi:type I restriction enzyme S subunit